MREQANNYYERFSPERNFARKSNKQSSSTEEAKVTIKELAELLVKLANNNSKVVISLPKEEQNKAGTAAFTLGILSSQKLREELNWLPIYNIEEGFKRTLKYLQTERKK